jgi:cytochrome c-type biogenesis protein CcmF
MLAEIGLAALLLAFASALLAVGAAVYAARRDDSRWLTSARNAAIATFPLLTVSTFALLAALLTQQYHISYVWSVTDTSTPTFYRFTALWGSQAGSLLFWTWLMSLFAFGAILLNWRRYPRLMQGVIAYTMATVAFFIGLSVFLENPFERWWLDATTGEIFSSALIPAGSLIPPAQVLAEQARGLNPLLRHFGMIIHPPMLYLGFVGFVIPFAFAMAAMTSRDLSTGWIVASRRWSLIAWLFLSLGLILGGRWAYDVLGWGGYWGWDPVENAAFLPWLLGTAFIHSVMIQEKRGMLKVWNLVLIISTFSMVMFATFATRSGLIDSVHAFARSEIGVPMFLFWAGITGVSGYLVLARRNEGLLRDDHRFTNILSRETLFVLNNVVFVALTLAIFWGSFGAPISSEMLTGTEITIGTEYYHIVTPPLFLLMYLLMGVAPLSAYGVTSIRRLGLSILYPAAVTMVVLVLLFVTGTREFGALLGYGLTFLAGFVAIWEVLRAAQARTRSKGETPLAATLALFRRNRRRYGGYIVHLGVTVIGIGVIGSTLYQDDSERLLSVGESLVLQDYAVRYDGITLATADDTRGMTIADVTVFRNGQEITRLRPRLDNFNGMAMTIAGQYSTLENDVYILLNDYREDTGKVRLWLYINPLVNLIWWGGLILIAGTLVGSWGGDTPLSPHSTSSQARREASEDYPPTIPKREVGTA